MISPAETRVPFLAASSSAMRVVAAMGVLFFLTPYLVRHIGVAGYGLWTLAFAVAGGFALLEFGTATAVLRAVACARSDGDIMLRNQTCSTFLFLNLLLGIVGWLGVSALVRHPSTTAALPAGLRSDAPALFQLIAARVLLVGLPTALLVGALYGADRIVQANKVQIAATLCTGVLAAVILSKGGGMVAVAWGYLVVGALELLANVRLALRVIPNFRLAPTLIRLSLARRLSGFTLGVFLMQLAGFIQLRADPLVIKVFLSLEAVGLFAVLARLAESTHLLSKQLANVLTPTFARLSAAGDQQHLAASLLTGTRIGLIPAVLLLACTITHGDALLETWMGVEFRPGALPLVILVAAATLAVPQLFASALLTMAGRTRITAGAALLATVVNLGVSIALLPTLGLLGVALGTLAAVVVTDTFVVVPAACRHLGVSGFRYVRAVIAPHLAPLAVHLMVTTGLRRLYPPTSITAVFLQSGCGVLSYLLTLWLSCFSSRRFHEDSHSLEPLSSDRVRRLRATLLPGS